MPGRQILAILAGFILATCAARHVRAQDDGVLLRMTRQHFDAHTVALDFTPAQQDAAQALFADYTREFDDAHNAYVAMVDWLWTGSSSHGWYGGESDKRFTNVVSVHGRQADEAWQFAARRLEAAWFDGLRRIAIGREDVVETLRCARLRERLLQPDRGWQPDGAQTDLVALIDDFEGSLADRPAIEQIMHEYIGQVNAHLLRMDDAFVTMRDRVRSNLDLAREADAAGNPSDQFRDAAAEVMAERASHTLKLWRLNVQAGERLLLAAPDDVKPMLSDALFEALHRYALPERGVNVGEAIRSALARSDLTESQRERVLAVQARWRAKRAAALPTLQREYLISIDVDFVRRNWGDSFGPDRQRAYEDSRASREAWATAREPWFEQCRALIGEIEAIQAEALP